VGVEFMYKNSFEVSIVSLKKGVGNIALFDETVEVLLASPYFSNKEFFIEQLKEIFFSKLIINYSLATNFKGMFHNFIQEYCFYLKEDNNSIVKLLDYSLIEFGLTLILFSLFIKLALAPFHTWLLDVYEGVPISSAFFFAVLTKLSLFVLLIRLCYSSFISLKSC
jgi:NADH:ubiquinone oxidoreductase subunit 4 (subunit M)